MKGHELKAVVAILVVVSVLALFPVPFVRPAQPIYQGQPLTFWAEAIYKDPQARLDGAAAMREIGAKGVPFLLHRLRSETPATKRFYQDIWGLLPDLLKRKMVFGEMGPAAEVAAPAISTLLATANQQWLGDAVVKHAHEVLRKIAPPPSFRFTWPKLPAVLQRRIPQPAIISYDLHRNIGFVLGLIGPRALPQLVPALKDHNDGVRLVAVEAMGSIAPKSDTVVRLVAKLLNDSNSLTRVNAALALGAAREALGKIDPDVAEKLRAETK